MSSWRPFDSVKDLSTASQHPSIVFLLLTSVVAALAYTLWPVVKKQWTIGYLPTPKPSSWVFGHLQMLRSDNHRVLRQAAKELGGIYRLRVFHQQVAVVVDAGAISTVLGQSESLSKVLEMASDQLLSQRPGHPTLFSSATRSPWWKLVRKGTAPAFVQKNIRHGMGDVVKIMDRVCDQMASNGEEKPLDLNNVTLRISMDVTGIVGFNKDFNTTTNLHDAETEATIENLKAAMLELFKQGCNPLRWLNIFDKNVRAGKQQMQRFQQEMRLLVAELKARGPPTEDDVSVAAHLLRLTDPSTGQPLADDLLASECGVYFAAGIESAGNALTWTMYMILQHPEVQAKLTAELDKHGFLATVDHPTPARMTYSDLSNLPYLSWVCKEAMRLRPVASTGTTRRTERELSLLGYKIPAGTLMLCPFDPAHRWEGNWPDRPEEFVPERWAERNADLMPETPEGKSSKQGEPVDRARRFLAFSTGPRQCIGQSLARMLHDVAIAMLFGRFTFQLAARMGGPEGVDKAEINRLTLQPGTGMWMHCKPRVSRSMLTMPEP